MATKKKKAKKGGSNGTKQEPKPVRSQRAPVTLTQTDLLNQTLTTMEQENWITKKQGKDFVESLVAVVQDSIGEFKAVNLFGLVKITPVLRPRRQVIERKFGEAVDPDAPVKRVTKPADVQVKANPLKGAGAGKAGAEIRPSVQKAQRTIQKGK